MDNRKYTNYIDDGKVITERKIIKDVYVIPADLKEAITTQETKEEINAYYDYVAKCIEKVVCSECGDDVEITDEWKDDEKREYKISGLCQKCQRKFFGI